MKYVLDNGDKKRPWYKGMDNMTPGELDDWIRFQRTEFYKIMVLLVITPVLMAITYALFNTDKDGLYEYMMIVTGICLGMFLVELTALMEQYKRVRLVKEEKGAIL